MNRLRMLTLTICKKNIDIFESDNGTYDYTFSLTTTLHTAPIMRPQPCAMNITSKVITKNAENRETSNGCADIK